MMPSKAQHSTLNIIPELKTPSAHPISFCKFSEDCLLDSVLGKVASLIRNIAFPFGLNAELSSKLIPSFIFFSCSSLTIFLNCSSSASISLLAPSQAFFISIFSFLVSIELSILSSSLL